MKKYRHSKYNKILVDCQKETIYIKISDKYGIILSAISENKEQLMEDINDACLRIRQKGGRKWLKKCCEFLKMNDYENTKLQ